MTLPEGFLFTQSNLQDYKDCQRRFQLKHLLHLAWPAVEVEPYQEYQLLMDQGSRFHKIVRQHLNGIPASKIEKVLGEDDTVRQYWINYQRSLRDGILERVLKSQKKTFAELTLSMPIEDFRLIAKYDVLVVNPESKLVILDWKTSHKRPKRKWLAERLQTHVYQFVLTRKIAGISCNEQADPDNVEMVYWFANDPDQPEHFKYSQQAYDEDKEYLENMIIEINQKSEDAFPLTPDEKNCLFCTYRSLCNRGVKPGELHQLEEWQESQPSSSDIVLDYEQIAEIAF